MDEASLSVRPRWARILLAAVRLAGLYAGGVLVLFIPLFLRSEYFDLGRQTWLGLSVLGAVCFALGFVALAVTRRLGFALLWGLLVWWWGVLVGRERIFFFLNEAFLGWTAFAVPLYVLSAIGLSSEAAGSRRARFEIVITLALWAIITVLAYFPTPREMLSVVDAPVQPFVMSRRAYVFAVWPFLIGGRELGRVVVTLWRARKGKQ